MPNDMLVDSGPLIALFDVDEQRHSAVVRWFKEQQVIGHTTMAVVTEVTYSLGFSLAAQVDFLRWVRSGAVKMIELIDEDLDRCIELMERYADLPADFADVTLVAVAERFGIAEVVTLDSDFRVYKLHGRRTFKLPLVDATC